MSPELPFDVLEHILVYLRRDKRTLAACSLVCRQFQTIVRALSVPWEEAKLSPSEKCLETPSIKQFLDEMIADPERAASYDQLTLSYKLEGPAHNPSLALVIEMIVTLCAHLPEVRDLQLESFEFNEPVLYGLLTVAGRIPTLESLCLVALQVDVRHLACPPWPHASVESWSASEGGSSRWALRRLLLDNSTIPAADLRSLVSFLERSRESISLESLGLCASLFLDRPEITDNRPGAPHSLGLRHFRSTVNDITRYGKVYKPGRENMSRLLSDLRRCRTLRSLRLDYDAAICLFDDAFSRRGRPRVPIRLPSHLVKALASTLNPWGPPPMPELERLCLVVHAPPDWFSGWKSAFASLAKALVGDVHKPPEKRRYPKFARLEVQSVVVPYMAAMYPVLWSAAEEEIRLQKAAREQNVLMPMLGPFVKAGIDVRVEID
ncbi:hypothetical protein FKP32DRAFT_1587150 [Trametes sanguinea]|nr:hypothetical protein FKP32DRAFT_1587150 [Trametes sanguinea]